MKVYHYTTDVPVFDTSLFRQYFTPEKVGIVDIETTGLSAERCAVVLVGLMIPQGDTFVAKQYLAEDLQEESAILKAFLDDVANLETLVTYNGERFDIPFIKRRMEILGLDPAGFHHIYDLDIYPILRKFSDVPKFVANLKQKTVEAFAGLWINRDDEIDGGQSVKLYFHYVATGDKEAEEKILLHNKDDIMQLGRLLPILRKTKFHEAMSYMGFPLEKDRVEKVEIRKGHLVIAGTQVKKSVNYISLEDAGSYCHFNGRERTFSISVELISRKGLVFWDSRNSGLSLDIPADDPAWIQDCMILQTEENIDYRAINKMASLLVERIRQDGL